MRDTVSAILQNEAERLLKISTSDGLSESSLKYLNALISTHQNFIGTEETPPEEQDTADLLASVQEEHKKANGKKQK